MDKRVKRTIKLIKNGVYKHYVIEGNENLTIKELCEKIKINRTTFYLHFSSLDDVIQAIQNDFLLNIVKIVKNNKTLDEKILYACEFVQKAEPRCAKLFKITDSKTFYLIKAFMEPELRILLAPKKFDDVSCEYVIDFILTGTISIFNKWISNGCKEKPMDLFYKLRELFK